MPLLEAWLGGVYAVVYQTLLENPDRNLPGKTRRVKKKKSLIFEHVRLTRKVVIAVRK